MKVNFPGAPPSNYSQQFFSQFLSRLTTLFNQVVSSQQEAPHIVLSSPNGKLWLITVDNAGVLHATAAVPATREARISASI